MFYPVQTKPVVTFTEDELDRLTDRIQNAGTEVVNAKAGAVSGTAFILTCDKCSCHSEEQRLES